jgi:signal transduction histidine kinase
MSNEKVDQLNRHAWEMRLKEPEESLRLSKRALKMASKDPVDKDGRLQSLRIMAASSQTLGDVESTLEFAREGLRLATDLGDVKAQIELEILIGAVAKSLDDYATALDHTYRSLSLSETHHIADFLGTILNQLGVIHDDMGQYNEALKRYQRALDLPPASDPEEDVLNRGRTLNNMAFVYENLGQSEKALACARKAWDIFKDTSLIGAQISSLHTVGHMYAALRDYDLALDYLHQSLALIPPDFPRPTRFSCYYDLARVFMEVGRTTEATEAAHEALADAERLGSAVMSSQAHEILATLYEAQGNAQLALSHHRAFHERHTTVFNDESDRRLKKLQISHDLAKAQLDAKARYLENTSLQQELEQYTKRLADLDEFAEMVAHDLQNPVGVILGYTELISSDFAKEVSPQVITFVETIHDTASKMKQIVNSLLLFAKTRQQEIQPAPVNMEYSANEAQMRLQVMIEKADAEISIVTPLPTVLGEPTWLEEVWVNYLSNAIKYGGKPPVIQIGATWLDDGRVRCWIKDNGNGISADKLDKLFQKFERLGQKHIRGQGLGLSLVRSILEKLGGEVSVESDGQPGHGSTFSFTLPVSEQPASKGVRIR